MRSVLSSCHKFKRNLGHRVRELGLLCRPATLDDLYRKELVGFRKRGIPCGSSQGLSDLLYKRQLHYSNLSAAQTRSVEPEQPEVQPLPTGLLSQLKKILGDRLSTHAATLDSHGKDESYRSSVPPQAVVFPQSTEEVSQVCELGRPTIDLEFG